MSYIEKERLIKADIESIENRVRHAFNQGYDLGYKEGKERTKSIEPKKGHWMGSSYDYICSNCEHSLNDLAQCMEYVPFSKPKFCPNCGVAMIEVEK